MSKTYFITTTIPYVNSRPHVGHAQEFVLADALSRFHQQKGDSVILQSGTDDNAFKNVLSAREAQVETKTFVDENAKEFERLLNALNVKFDHFVRTTSPEHKLAVHAFLRALKKEDVYHSNYSGLYCQGCEDFFDPAQLVQGVCPDHLRSLETISEKNVFFKLSKYQDQIREIIANDVVQIHPPSRKKEILNFITSGLRDISLSRSAQRSGGWGISYPDQADQVVYVWIDALINYLSGVGYGRDDAWKEVWNSQVQKVHVIGKNVWKFHAIYWIGLLLSAGLPLPQQIIIHGFLTNNGVKISKSLNNSIDPFKAIEKYGADGIRFYLLSCLSTEEDADFSEEHLLRAYNSELANKFGNLVSRILALVQKVGNPVRIPAQLNSVPQGDFLRRFQEGFERVDRLNSEINSLKPWELTKEQIVPPEQRHFDVTFEKWLGELGLIGDLFAPILPETCKKLKAVLKGVESGTNVKVQLFPRLK